MQAEAVILDELSYGNVVDRDFHGVDWAHYKYILEVRPSGEAPFRVETKVKVPIFSSPSQGDTVSVTFDPKSHQAEVRSPCPDAAAGGQGVRPVGLCSPMDQYSNRPWPTAGPPSPSAEHSNRATLSTMPHIRARSSSLARS